MIVDADALSSSCTSNDIQCRVIKKGGFRKERHGGMSRSDMETRESTITGKCHYDNLFPTIITNKNLRQDKNSIVLNAENSGHPRTGRKVCPGGYMDQKCKFSSNCVI